MKRLRLASKDVLNYSSQSINGFKKYLFNEKERL